MLLPSVPGVGGQKAGSFNTSVYGD